MSICVYVIIWLLRRARASDLSRALFQAVNKHMNLCHADVLQAKNESAAFVVVSSAQRLVRFHLVGRLVRLVIFGWIGCLVEL